MGKIENDNYFYRIYDRVNSGSDCGINNNENIDWKQYTENLYYLFELSWRLLRSYIFRYTKQILILVMQMHADHVLNIDVKKKTTNICMTTLYFKEKRNRFLFSFKHYTNVLIV